jgi:hypothetical protein
MTHSSFRELELAVIAGPDATATFAGRRKYRQSDDKQEGQHQPQACRGHWQICLDSCDQICHFKDFPFQLWSAFILSAARRSSADRGLHTSAFANRVDMRLFAKFLFSSRALGRYGARGVIAYPTTVFAICRNKVALYRKIQG